MKIKKYAFLVLSLTLVVLLVSCSKKVKIELPYERVTLKVDENITIEYETNDKEGLIFSSKDENIATVNNQGVIIGLTVGETTITLKSKSSNKVTATLIVAVTAKDEEGGGEDLLEFSDLTLAMGMEHDLEASLADGYSFELSNPYVATINEDGFITAELQGDVVVSVLKDGVKYSEFNLNVMNKARTIALGGPSTIYNNEVITYEVTLLPRSAFPLYEFEVLDENIFTIDENGVITPKSNGTTTLKVKSLQDDVTFDEMEVTIKDVIIVKGNLGTASNLVLGNWEYKKNIDLFDNINDAINAANTGDKVLILEGQYDEEVVIDKPITLEGDNAVIKSDLLIKAIDVTVSNLTFIDNANIDATDQSVNNFKFINNIVKDINLDVFIRLNDVNSVLIANNNFSNLKEAIVFENLGVNIDILIEKNNFSNLLVPITINANDKLSDQSMLRIYRNNIIDVDSGFAISLSTVNATSKSTLYTRFNEVKNYNQAIVHNGPNIFEHTFNYWGEFDIDNFTNVDAAMLLGYYTNPDDFVRETTYNPQVPLLVTWNNVIDELWLGDDYEVDVTVIPYTTNALTIQLQVINMELAELKGGTTLTPKRSGEFHLRVGSFANPSKTIEHLIKVTTDPGIHLEIDDPTQDLVVGKRFNINGVPFPYDRVEEPVKYESSNPSVATVTVGGLVEIIAQGEFEIIASLVNEPLVKQVIGFKTYNELDDLNILDFYAKRQLSYSQVHHIELHGADSFLRIHNESVTRVLADTIESVEKIIPVASGFRPGTLMRSNIPDKFKLNEDNVVWVVVHDTGNSNAGAGALMHGTYLYNAAVNGGREASWHYTIDSHLRFQSVPENEIAYHAGDGSGTGAVPKEDGESPALGGGNTNGIGIEMSVQRDGDVWKTWQNTAQFSASLLHKYNLPLSHITYHNDFSGKNCPQTLRRAGLLWLFEEFIQNEYDLIKIFGNSIDSVRFISHNPEILDNTGIIVSTPDQSTNVSYTLEVVMNGETLTRTFTTLVEGLWR